MGEMVQNAEYVRGLEETAVVYVKVLTKNPLDRQTPPPKSKVNSAESCRPTYHIRVYSSCSEPLTDRDTVFFFYETRARIIDARARYQVSAWRLRNTVLDYDIQLHFRDEKFCFLHRNMLNITFKGKRIPKVSSTMLTIHYVGARDEF